MATTGDDRFILEDPAGKALGILLRSGGSFVFYACEPCLFRLDERIYESVLQARRAIQHELSAATATR